MHNDEDVQQFVHSHTWWGCAQPNGAQSNDVGICGVVLEAPSNQCCCRTSTSSVMSVNYLQYSCHRPPF
jgi:hypothetical protein